MNRQEHLLTIAMEECNELAQRLAKAIRFGMDQVQDAPKEGDYIPRTDVSTNPDGLNNTQRIYAEYYHLRAVLGMAGIDAWDRSDSAQRAEQAKMNKVNRYLRRSAELGTLDQ